MYSEAEIRDLRAVIRDAKLYEPPGFAETSDSELADIFNGVGPDGFPESLRRRTTRFFKDIEAAALVHDWMYSRSDGTEAGRDAADTVLRINGLRAVDWRHPWWSWRRYAGRLKVNAAYDALKFGGRLAWLEGYFANKKKG